MTQDIGRFSHDQFPEDEYPHQLNCSPTRLAYLDFPGAHPRPATPNVLARLAVEAPEIVEFENEFSQLGNNMLPIFEYREEIADTVQDNSVTIVVGTTGSGKSTQLPQILVERGFDVTESQPRRIAARMVAERIESELAEKIGPERAAEIVGHQTAENSTITENTRISIITDGIQFMKQLNDDPIVDGKHVYILDEVHEWNVNTEFTIGVINQIVAQHPGARFVLTSATMDAHSLADFFAEATGKPAPVIEVPGRMYDIEREERPESTVVDVVLENATEDPTKDILVFVSGKQEISDTIDEIRRRLPEDIASTATILPLHAKMRPQDQDLVNKKTEGIKVIVSTKLAQTSLTIDNIGVVVDSGLERRIELDEEGNEGLRIRPVSQADCNQRAGRTGRVASGKYILTRYNKYAKFISYTDRLEYPLPDIWSTDLDRETLRLASAGIDISSLKTFHHVKHMAIERAKESLYDLGALDGEARVTALGRKMNEFPVKATSARMLMEALPFTEKIRAQLAAIVAAEEVGGLQYFAPEAGKAWQRLTEETTSDSFAQLDIFIAAQEMTDAELAEHDLDVRAVRQAQLLYRTLMRRGGVGDTELTYPSVDEKKALEQSICAGLINWIYEHQGGGIYKRVGAPDSVPRELSNRTVVERRPRLVVGRPYSVEFMKNGRLEQRDIIERATAVRDPQVFGRVAAQHMISWQPERFVWRNGVLKSVAKQVLHGALRLGNVMEMEAVDTEETYALVQESLLENPGSAQSELRDLKKELERIQHLTTRSIPQLQQADFIGLLHRAINEAGVYNQHYIDQKLRDIMMAEGITLDEYVPAAERARIFESSPNEIVTEDGIHLILMYRRGIPIVTQYDWTDIDNCPDRLYLSDGREVKFRHGKRIMPLAALRANLQLQPA